mgnify:FL=1
MTEPTQEKRSYKNSLNLPKTGFSMKANLVQNEPATQKKWAQEGLYEQIRQARKGSPRYVFHDGPPYANGSIHLGHMLNKVLKDIVVRSRTMMGFDCPYIPGWDCHGLPIEHKVMQELGDKARELATMQIRGRCKTYAEKFIKLQSGQMQKLLTLADYDHPYLTMVPEFEGATIEVFASLIEQGLVYRALKPVHWSIANRTALADAELEYEDRKDTSVYVMFELTSDAKLPGDPTHLMIWTTTPWTLPANVGVAAAPRAEYGVYPINKGGKDYRVIIATDLASKVLGMGDIEAPAPAAVITGQDLRQVKYRHPFIDRVSPVVTAEYVTLEDGTGLVHTAPGHGVEDYQTGLREGLPIYCPVLEDGTFDDTVPQWLREPGVDVWKANGLIVDHLRNSGHLFFDHQFLHSYPHDWRSKTPTIFRATEQWFVGVDRPMARDGKTLRGQALEQTREGVKFFPEWGRNRMRGMLESRPDWCISRQRAWGLPIPAFFAPVGTEAGKAEPLLTPASVRAVAKTFREQGSDAWFKLESQDILKHYDVASDADAPAWAKTLASASAGQLAGLRKSTDIFDVWFESGSSWNAVIRERFGAESFPTDLYLEGSDQHRGWFQLSLLPAVGVTGLSPFKNVLTHGFMVDKNGKKMSKSLGNALEVDTLLKDFGADVCRWWVGSLNFENDIKVDLDFFKVAGEEYRKVRNTLRYLLSNLYDFNASSDAHTFTAADASSIDAWILGELDTLVADVRAAYESFDFRRLSEKLFNFCNQTLSAVYLAATKDRMYCDLPGSVRRRRSQTAMYLIASALIRLVAPILPHTAEEAWASLHNGQAKQSVHLELFPAASGVSVDANWAGVIDWRDEALKAVEEARSARGIENPLDVGLVVETSAASAFLARFDAVDLADLCGISRVTIKAGSGEKASYSVQDLREEPRCERSWKRDGTVKQRSDGGLLSDRDAAALGLA